LKRLLIHIGYPKTASTSLQEGLFFKLHNQGKINFLGRTTKSTHSLWGNSKFSGEDWAVHIRKHFIFDKPLPAEFFPLRDDVLNVLSDEDLTIHSFFHHAQFGLKKNPLETASLLKNLSGQADEVSILLTLRNQVDLIESCFLQKYRYIYTNAKDVGFRDFILNSDGNLRLDTAEIFDFNNVTSHYSSIFNNKVNLLIFEDLKHNKEVFFEKLGRIMQMDGKALLKVFGGEHFRQKGVKIEKGKVKVSEPSVLGTIFCRMNGEKPGPAFFTKRWYLSYSVFQNLEKKLFVKTRIINTPEISLEEKQAIFNFFKDRNRQFALENQLDLKNLSNYGYF
jgi:hypothetical protein